MTIKDEIPFERVHRLGRYKPDQEKPRPIIAKFHRFKDRGILRQSARDTLTGTQYGVKEQFPIEVESKRRTLYPIMKKARENKENKVRMVRDRLFINDNEVAPQQLLNLHQPKQLSFRQSSYSEQQFQRTDRQTYPGQIHHVFLPLQKHRIKNLYSKVIIPRVMSEHLIGSQRYLTNVETTRYPSKQKVGKESVIPN